MQVVLQLVYPRRCPICDGIVPNPGEYICEKCAKIPVLVREPWCMKCGKPLESEEALCEDCKNRPHEFIRGRILFDYESVAKSIYRFKYGDRPEYGEYFGRCIADELSDFILRVKPDALVPVPLHRKRLSKRGYNQSEILAKVVSKYTHIPVLKGLVKRRKNTIPMKLLAPGERQNNIKNAFIVKGNSVKLKTIIIIDDIYTTGATIDEIGRSFKDAGSTKIYFITLSGGASI